MGDLSKNFSRSEFACQGESCCGHSSPVSPRLLIGLQVLRDMVRTPIKISSGFRCKKHNAEIGGANESYHCKAEAADLQTPKGYDVDTFANTAENVFDFAIGGIVKYDWGIHVDVRVVKYREDRRTKNSA